MKKCQLLILLFLAVIVLSGCMYPQKERMKNQIPYEEQIKTVQAAVDQYREATGGLLPIKTKEEATPIYQKYLLDFKKITPQYMPEIPGNAYESGGVFQYVLVDVETAPAVKIFDLRMAETIREIKIRLKAHQYPPYKEQIAPHVFILDYEKLGYKESPVAISPYSGRELPFVITGDAEIYVDYRSDLYEALEKNETVFEPGEDIRSILVEDTAFVPAYSLPYTLDAETNEPIFSVK